MAEHHKESEQVSNATLETPSVQQEFIAYDRVGLNDDQGRFTHVPTNATLLWQRHWGQTEWNKAKLDWFQQYDGKLTVHNCPGAYSTEGDFMGTVAEICESLKHTLAVQQD